MSTEKQFIRPNARLLREIATPDPHPWNRIVSRPNAANEATPSTRKVEMSKDQRNALTESTIAAFDIKLRATLGDKPGEKSSSSDIASLSSAFQI